MSTAVELKCKGCQKDLPSNARFCPTCGTAIISNAREVAEPTAAPPVITPPNNQPTQLFEIHWPTLKKPSVWGTALALLLLLVVLLRSGGNSQSVDSFLRAEQAKIEQQLNQIPNEFGKRIEQAHGTVTYKGAKLKSITGTTVDGSRNAGPNGSNVSEVVIVITAYWDGFFQKDGYTEIRIVYDCRGGQIKTTEYLASNALVNFETIDWFSVGWTVGRLLTL